MDNKTTFGYWIKIAPFTGYKIEKYSRPAFVAGKETPEDLSGLTMGDLIKLSTMGDSNDSFYTICEIVMGLTRKQVDKARAVDVVRLVGWVTAEAEKINKLFKGSEAKPTEDEQKAGIKLLQFGLFGMVDWYARRMGIQDHDQVMSVPWLRIWKCMDMDNKTNQYNRRLQDVVNEKYRRKNRANR